MLIQFKKLNHLHSLIILVTRIMLLVIQTLKTFFYSLPFIAVPKPFSFFSVYHQKNVGLSPISMPQHFLPNIPISLTRAWNKRQAQLRSKPCLHWLLGLEDKKKKRATVLGDAYDDNGGAVIAEGNLDPGGSRCGLGNRGSGGYWRERERKMWFSVWWRRFWVVEDVKVKMVE